MITDIDPHRLGTIESGVASGLHLRRLAESLQPPESCRAAHTCCQRATGNLLQERPAGEPVSRAVVTWVTSPHAPTSTTVRLVPKRPQEATSDLVPDDK